MDCEIFALLPLEFACVTNLTQLVLVNNEFVLAVALKLANRKIERFV